MEERLQKLLSSAGICSRRKAEEYISAGYVKVNNITAKLGDKADPEKDRVTVDGRPLQVQSETVWIMLHKPRGYVTTLSDEKGRRTAAQLVEDCGFRVWPVGRLDMDSEGLLIFTNDGDGTHGLLHPSHQVEKEYEVTVRGDIEQAISVLRRMCAIAGLEVKRLKRVREGMLLLGDLPAGKWRRLSKAEIDSLFV